MSDAEKQLFAAAVKWFLPGDAEGLDESDFRDAVERISEESGVTPNPDERSDIRRILKDNHGLTI